MSIVKSPEQTEQVMTVEAGIAGVQARVDSEVKAAILMARAMPRRVESAQQELINTCRQAAFAEKAVYSFKRGGATIKGPSVHMAREAARCWTNVRHGIRIVSKDEDMIHVVGFAWDLEANLYIESEDKFRRLIQRRRGDATVWVEPDERDERELTQRRGAICVRNAILQVLPEDMIKDAVAEAEKTNKLAAEKALKENPQEAVKKLVDSFDKLGVNVTMLEKWLGHGMDLVTAAEVAELRKIGSAIRDGQAKREDEFDMPPTAEAKADSTLAGLVAREQGK